MAPDRFDLTDSIVGLAHTLRAAGVDASADRVHTLVGALDRLDAVRRRDVYWAGRLTLCGSVDDIERYDAVFAAYFGDRAGVPRRPPHAPLRAVEKPAVDAEPGTGDRADDGERRRLPAAASATEVLRVRDVAAMDAAERELLNRLLAAFALPGERRRTRRLAPAHRGRVDAGRTMRTLLRSGGETPHLARRDRRERPRRVVLLVDVSGSMSAYADALLRFAHAATRRRAAPTEVFTIGTRLTRVTRETAHRDADAAMAAVAQAVPDWSGGTRLGDLLKDFLDLWGQRGMARGAVVVVLSDGWERGDPSLLAAQMARLHRLAHRVVWANPRKARPGYEPVAAGMAAALPHVDDFVEGHSLAALERLAAVVAGAASGREPVRA